MSTPDHLPLIEARVQREREWMHARWLERMTPRQIAAGAALPPEQGGLGIQVSPQAVTNMIQTYRRESGEVTLSIADRRDRQSDEVDMRARAARRDLDVAYAGLREAEAITVHPDESAGEAAAILAGKAKLIESYQGMIDRADRRLDSAQQREDKLHGLAAPVKVEADVTHHDAVDAELTAMMARLGIEADA